MMAEPSGLQAPSGSLRLSETDIASGLVEPTLAEHSGIDPDGRIDPGTGPEHVTPDQGHPHPRTTGQEHDANKRLTLPSNHDQISRHLQRGGQ